MRKFRFQWLDMEPTHQMLLLAFLRLTVPMAGRGDPRTTKFPEIPVSLERNTEVFRHPLL